MTKDNEAQKQKKIEEELYKIFIKYKKKKTS